ncbi:MAG TPA: cell division protein ZapE [Actinomycetales bacterium]|nr:cell division protein ZapE [Actinomycetales bacterium]
MSEGSRPDVGEPAVDIPRLADRRPVVDRDTLLAELQPPPRFAGERFASYRPDPQHPSQAQAVETLGAFAEGIGRPRRHGLLRRRRTTPARGVYLDGGFGVGKTHLLAAVWHEAPAPKVFGTFVELTNLVGALGFAETVDVLSAHRLVCIDEFELDDPGDTVLMSTLLSRLAEAGVALAATSNTLPGALGEGRFAAGDFLREIQALSSRFDVVRIEGEDFRHRGLPEPPDPWTADEVTAWASGRPGATLDELDALCRNLSRLHPSRFGALVDDVTGVGLTGVRTVTDQNVALRLVALVDRLYDRDVPVAASGDRLDGLFASELLQGGYRKKYLRCLSRLTALAREAHAGPTSLPRPMGLPPLDDF